MEEIVYAKSTDEIKEEKTNPIIKDVFRHVDDRGVLTQTFGDNFKPKRCYEIKDCAGVMRGMHGHKEESKLVYVSKGLVKFIIIDLEELDHFMTHRQASINEKIVILSSDKPQTLYIPPRFYHGFISLKDSIIHFYSDKTLGESKLDDFRIEICEEDWLYQLFKVKPR